jgi:putative transposase
MKTHFSELTDSQWQFIAKIINGQRKRKHSLQDIVNAVFWINTTGCQWRNLASKYPPWQTVFYHFTQFKLRGIWEEERLSEKGSFFYAANFRNRF